MYLQMKKMVRMMRVVREEMMRKREKKRMMEGIHDCCKKLLDFQLMLLMVNFPPTFLNFHACNYW